MGKRVEYFTNRNTLYMIEPPGRPLPAINDALWWVFLAWENTQNAHRAHKHIQQTIIIACCVFISSNHAMSLLNRKFDLSLAICAHIISSGIQIFCDFNISGMNSLGSYQCQEENMNRKQDIILELFLNDVLSLNFSLC